MNQAEKIGFFAIGIIIGLMLLAYFLGWLDDNIH